MNHPPDGVLNPSPSDAGKPAIVDARVLMDSTPQPSEDDVGCAYRDGYVAGWDEAARLVNCLYRRGYIRGGEIENILAEFSGTTLSDWKYFNLRNNETPDGAPIFHMPPSWAQIRQNVFARDGHKCRACGSDVNLEAHHRIPVAEGGLPTKENLITLCRECHRGAA